MKTNLMHYLSSVYFVNELVSSIFCSPSSGGILLSELGWNSVPSQLGQETVNLKSTTRTNCCMYVCMYVCMYIYIVYLLMMDYRYARNMQRLTK
jgi:hypothetical protein